MDKDGNYTDRYGRPLAINTRVRMSANGGDYGVPVDSVGVVEVLPRPGSDWHSYPSVRFQFDNKARHIPDTSLECVDAEPGSTVAHLESMIAGVEAATAAKRAFLDSLADD